MNDARGGIPPSLVVMAVMASCQSSGGNGPPVRDSGGADVSITCGASGEPCCNGSCPRCCLAGLTCSAGTCTASSQADAESGDGSDGAGRGGGDASDGGCSPGSTRCSGNAVEACDAGGQWDPPWPCATGACSDGACTGSTTAATTCAASGDGLTNCGASAENCCTSVEVPGGTYFRIYTAGADGSSGGEADPASVSGFRLDKYLVTVGRFRQFVNAVSPADGGSGWRPAAGSGKHAYLNGGNGLNAVGGGYEPGWIASDDSNIAPTDSNLKCGDPQDTTYPTWTPSPGNHETLPANCTTWWEAYAFCIWDGGFLPSEAEWEYAAAGGSQQRAYPWGSTDPGTGQSYAVYGCEFPTGSGTCTDVSNVAPVGTATLGAGRWGQLDLAGDIWEWNVDNYVASYVDPCIDCVNLMASSNKVRRGGSFNFDGSRLFASYRYTVAPTYRDFDVGWRCARAP